MTADFTLDTALFNETSKKGVLMHFPATNFSVV